MASGNVCMSSEVVVGGGVLSCKRGICLNTIQISSSSSSLMMCVPPLSGHLSSRRGLKLKACSSRDHVKEINNKKKKKRLKLLNKGLSEDLALLPHMNSDLLIQEATDEKELKKKRKNIKDKLKNSGYSEESSAAETKKMIEVCMGSKCKKSGAKALMEEIEKEVGIGVEVVECKCMGKCRTAPNFKIHAA